MYMMDIQKCGSDGTLNSNEYMTILAQFPSGTFNTSNKLNHDFNYYYNMAEEGATHYNSNNDNSNNCSICN